MSTETKEAFGTFLCFFCFYYYDYVYSWNFSSHRVWGLLTDFTSMTVGIVYHSISTTSPCRGSCHQLSVGPTWSSPTWSSSDKKHWRCLRCNCTLKYWNATKDQLYVNKVWSGKSICWCCKVTELALLGEDISWHFTDPSFYPPSSFALHPQFPGPPSDLSFPYWWLSLCWQKWSDLGYDRQAG